MASPTVYGIPVIDIDSHYNEPPDLWTSRAPAKYRDLVPRVVKEDDGRERWVVGDGVNFGPLGIAVVRKDGSKARGVLSLPSSDEMDMAATDPKLRLGLLDRLGISQQIIYPNVVGFGSEGFMRAFEDEELRNACARIYNDAVLENLQAEGEGRLFPQAVVPFWDIEASVKEVQRVKKLGSTGITLTGSPQSFGLPYFNDAAWDPFWATCQDLEVTVNFHIGAIGADTRVAWEGYGPQRDLVLLGIGLFLNNFRVIVNLIFSGLLERYPRLNFVSVESGIGWLPFLLEAMDYHFDELVTDEREGLTMRPSEYFQRQIYASFWFEDFGPRTAIQRIGEDNVLFETDFPHPTCLYPGVREHLTEVLADVDDSVRRKVLHDNAARIYGLPDPD